MSPDRIVSGEEILAAMPHRYENILVDQVCIPSEMHGSGGSLSVKISRDDAFGRFIFAKQKRPGEWVVLVTVFMEILALGSIVGSCKIGPNILTFFAGISNFEKLGDLFIGQEAKGTVEKKKDKGGFLLCGGQLYSGDALVAKGDMLAFFVDSTQPVSASAKKIVSVDLTHDFEMNLIKDPDLKSPDMYMIDTLVMDRLPEGRALAHYTYPTTHPLVKGHFPGRPVMMGVCQWMMVEDAVLALACRWKNAQDRQGLYRVSGFAELIKPDGTSVCEIKSFEVQVYMDVPGFLNQVELLKTEKISFRDSVSPGEKVYIHLTQLQISNG